MACSLSYVLTTRNKLPLLRVVMAGLLEQIGPDEEIVVTDGASTDGTADYLRELHASGRIHQFASQRDSGEAHGMNRAVLMARGDIIKIVTDDDAFFWKGIRDCKHFLQTHPEIDLLATEGGLADCTTKEFITHTYHRHGFERYRDHKVEFEFPGLGLMIRRSSLALTGLFDVRYLRVDSEFALRVTSGPAKLAWCASPMWVRVQNQQSNSVTFNERVIQDTVRLNRYYGVVHREPEYWRVVEDSARAILKPLKRRFSKTFANLTPPPASYEFKEDWGTVFRRCDEWLAAQNQNKAAEFLTP